MSRQSHNRPESSHIPTGSPLGSHGSRIFDNFGSDLTRRLSGSGWVRKVSTGSCEIQRLSSLAFFEKQKHGNRKYRLLKDGKVVGYFSSKEEIHRALQEMTKADGADDAQRFTFNQMEASDDDRPVHHSGTSRRSLSHNAPRSQSRHDLGPVSEPPDDFTRTSTSESHTSSRQWKSLSPKSNPGSAQAHENGMSPTWGAHPRVDQGPHHTPAAKPDYALDSESDSDEGENGHHKKNLPEPSTHTTDSEAGTQSEASTNLGSSFENMQLNSHGSHTSHRRLPPAGLAEKSSAPPSPRNPRESKPISPSHQATTAPKTSPRPLAPEAIALPRTRSTSSSDDGQAGSPAGSKLVGSLKPHGSQERLHHPNRLHATDSSLRVRAPSPRAPHEIEVQNASPLKAKEGPPRHPHPSSAPVKLSSDHELPNNRGGGAVEKEKRENRREILVSRKAGARVEDNAHSPPPVGRANSSVGTKSTGPGPFVRKLSVGPKSGSPGFGRQSSETFGSPGRCTSINPSQHVAHKQSSARLAAGAGKSAPDASSPATRATNVDNSNGSSPHVGRQSSSLLAPAAPIRRFSRDGRRSGARVSSDTSSPPLSNNSPRMQQGPSPGNGSLKSTESSPRVSPRMGPTLEPKKRSLKSPSDADPAEQPSSKEQPEEVPAHPRAAKPPKPQWTGPVLTEPQKPVATKETVVAWYYDDPTNTWTYKDLQVRLAEEWFSKGAMRLAYQMVICDPDGTERQFVAKLYNDFAEKEIIAPDNTMFGSEDPERIVGKNWALRTLRRQAGCEFEAMLMQICCPEGSLFSLRDFLTWHRRLKLFKIDVEMQGFCQTYAAEFNKRNPPKPVVFLDAFLIVCVNRPKQPIFSCEPMILGEFIKHNNNCGQVQERSMERNTPQAFSHFTYWFSRNQYIIVDIQGVGDTYTDPQVHSADRSGFGMGNLGQEGIESFFKTHRCNNICSGLGLVPPHKKEDESGTKYH